MTPASSKDKVTLQYGPNRSLSQNCWSLIQHITSTSFCVSRRRACSHWQVFISNCLFSKLRHHLEWWTKKKAAQKGHEGQFLSCLPACTVSPPPATHRLRMFVKVMRRHPSYWEKNNNVILNLSCSCEILSCWYVPLTMQPCHKSEPDNNLIYLLIFYM